MKLRKFLAKNPEVRIFLATDSRGIEDTIKKEFGRSIITYPKKFWAERKDKTDERWDKNIYR